MHQIIAELKLLKFGLRSLSIQPIAKLFVIDYKLTRPFAFDIRYIVKCNRFRRLT